MKRMVVGAIVLAAVGSAAGQTSPYFVLSGDQATFSVLQGGRFLRSWGVASMTAQYQYPMAVNETVHTMGANEGDVGAEYDLFGADLGTRYTHPPGQGRCWDGTTDGEHFYAIDTAGTVARYDAGWTSPVILFDAGGIGALTYDPTNDSLWVSQFSGTNLVIEYDMAGTALRSFDTGHAQNMALALDHADGTLWLHDRTSQGTFEQWSKDGVMLARITYPEMLGQNALAGEFQFTDGCYPDCTGEGTLDIFDFLCFQDAFVQMDPYADCTGEGTFDIFDFLCFKDEFVMGCP